MPNTFKNKIKNGTNTSANAFATVYTCPANTTTVVLSINLCNTTSSQINVKIKLIGDESGFLGFNIPIPAESSFEFMAGNKTIMEAGHVLQVSSNSANSLDTIMGIMEQT